MPQKRTEGDKNRRGDANNRGAEERTFAMVTSRRNHGGHLAVVTAGLLMWRSSFVPADSRGTPHAPFFAGAAGAAEVPGDRGGGVRDGTDGADGSEEASSDSSGGAGTCEDSGDPPMSRHPDGDGVIDADDDPCSLYLAESSIPNAGLGIYTSVDVDEGDHIGWGDLLIPVTNRDRDKNGWWLLDEAVWNAEAFDDDVLYPESLAKTVGFVPGCGAAVNCHPGLVNAKLSGPSADSAGLHRTRDAGAGAFSSHHSLSAVASRDVAAGEEIFLDYGRNWFLQREERLGVTIPFAADFQRADGIVLEMHSLFNDARLGNVTTEFERRAWNAIRTTADGRLRSALPEDVADLGHASSVGTARHSLPESVRSPQWLRGNGFCIDNLRAGTSTISQAGRGAFIARRRAPRGSVVAPVPVMQLGRDSMVMFRATRNEKTDRITYSDDAVMGHQLILNYCYGHPSSPVLLLPYSPMVNFINHGGMKANVELRWSNSTLNGSGWLSLSLEELVAREFGLMMELVALRDIAPGEEVLLDYGRDWTDAWEAHVRNFEPSPPEENGRGGHYVSAEKLTEMLGPEPLRTESEQLIDDPYPTNVHTACHYSPSQGMDNAVRDGRTIEGTWTDAHEKKCLRPCRLLARSRPMDDGTATYTAEMMNGAQLRRGCAIPRKERHVVSSIPRNEIVFIDKPYTRDHYIPGAFRHEIGLAEEVFPDAWKA